MSNHCTSKSRNLELHLTMSVFSLAASLDFNLDWRALPSFPVLANTGIYIYIYTLEEGPPSGKNDPTSIASDVFARFKEVNFEHFSHKNHARNVFFEIWVPMCRPKGHPGENDPPVAAARRPFGPPVWVDVWTFSLPSVIAKHVFSNMLPEGF